MNSSTQKQIVLAMMHGDGYVVVNNRSGKAKLDIYHSEKQYDYIMWKAEVLNNISGVSCQVKEKIDTRPLKTKKCRVGYRLLTNFNRYFYNLWTSPMKFQLKSLVKEPALAVLWQDDGALSQHKTKNGYTYSTAVLCTDSWDHGDLAYFRNKWNDAYGWCPEVLNATCRGGHYRRLRMKKAEMLKFSSLVEEHCVECMKYKLLKP